MQDIRPVVAADLPQIKALIQAAWSGHDEPDAAVVDALTFTYLNPVMHASSFGRVAVYDHQVVGVVFCSHQDALPSFRWLQSDGVREALALLKAGQQDLQGVVAGLNAWEKAYAQLMAGRSARYQANIELLCVHPDWQRRNVATTLLSEVLAYCNELETAYLGALADTPEQVAFYTEAGFQEVAKVALAPDLFPLQALGLCEKIVPPIASGN